MKIIMLDGLGANQIVQVFVTAQPDYGYDLL